MSSVKCKHVCLTHLLFLLSLLLVLSSLDEYEHTVLADDLRKQSFEEGALIVTAGDKPQDPADCRFYFVLTGQCVATKRVQVGEETDTVVCTYYGKGDFFGELLVLGDVQERQYSVQAHGGACEVVFLDKVSFEKCLSPNRSVVKELRAKRKSTRLADEARQIASGV
jgi:CRP-like cAMP-binding protein